MHRAAVAAFLALSTAASAGEGVYVSLDGGYALWNKDALKARLNAQLGTTPVPGTNPQLTNAELLLDKQLPEGGLFGLHLGYNIAGHVAFEGSLMLRPWDVTTDARGGAGLLGMGMRWFPLQGLVKPSRQYDLSFLTGMHYLLSGSNGVTTPDPNDPSKTIKIENTGRGFDAMAVELGASLELYPARWVSFGITPRMYVIDASRFIISWDKRDQGSSIPIGGKGNLTMYSVSLSMSFHFEPLPD